MSYTPTLSKIDIERICQYMNLPREYWGAKRSLIPDHAQQVIDRFVDNYQEMLRKGVGFVFMGPPGVGKTAAAVYLAKVAKMLPKLDDTKHCTCYFTRAWDLRESYRKGTLFDTDNDISVLTRCKEVDCLIIDDLTLEDAKENQYYSWTKFYHDLVVPRCHDSKITLITTRLSEDVLINTFGELIGSTKGHLFPLRLNGEDQRSKQHDELKKELMMGVAQKAKVK